MSEFKPIKRRINTEFWQMMLWVSITALLAVCMWRR